MKYFVILFIILILYIKFHNKLKIKYKTFFKRGFRVKRGVFGIYCYVGMQGEGKTYSCAEYVYDNYNHLQIFSNVTFFNIDYTHFIGFKEMLELRDKLDMAKYLHKDFIIFNNKKILVDFDKQILFVYDEIFSELSRGDKLSNDVLDFITQMRKRHYILLTTAQIWSDIPITWRRLTRYEIDCHMFFNILIKTFRDAEHMKWSNDDQEFVAPLISTTITHTRKCVSSIYDTFELIHNKLSTFEAIPPRNVDNDIWEDDIDDLEELPSWKK